MTPTPPLPLRPSIARPPPRIWRLSLRRRDISKKGPAHEMQFPANDMMSDGDISYKISAHELEFPANDMMSGGDMPDKRSAHEL